MVSLFLAVTHGAFACEGESAEKVLEDANTIYVRQVANERLKAALTPLNSNARSLYSDLRLVSGVYQPRVGFQVLECNPETGTKLSRVLWFKPVLNMMALVYRKNAGRNQPLSQVGTGWNDIDLIKERVKFSDLVTEPLDTNAWLAESVKENQPVLIKHLKKSPMILKDQHIRVVAISDGVRVDVDGVALQFGQYMEKIAVRLSASKQTVYAQVIDKGTAKID
jgi:flagella basal body P-ring formation protein FlgA